MKNKFNKYGYLPEGIHDYTFKELYDDFSFSPKRKILLNGMKNAIAKLHQAGCKIVYIDGSFISNKLEPNDYDACFEDSPAILKFLRGNYPEFLMFSTDKQKQKYNGEFLVANWIAKGNVRYVDFFQQIKRSKKKKGIVRIKLENYDKQ